MDNERSLRKQAGFLLLFLGIQYALGMYAAFFVNFPRGIQNHAAWQFATSQWPTLVHAILGILLFVGALVMMIRSRKNAAWKKPAIIGFIMVIIAGLGGERFVTLQDNAWSLVMALGFIFAVFSYGWGLARTKTQKNS